MVGIVVPRVDENEQLYQLGIDALDSTFSQYTDALWDEPSITGDIGRWRERLRARESLKETLPSGGPYAPIRRWMGLSTERENRDFDPRGRMSDTDAEEQYGVPGELSFIGKGPQPRAVAQQLWEQKRAELARRDIYSRFKGGAAQQVAGFGVALISQALDPINAGAALVPIVGPARYAIWAERFGPTLARAARGAVEGVVGTAALEPFSMALAQDEQRDYTFEDALMNVTLGAIIGAGLQTAGGAVADRFNARRQPEAVQRASRATPEVNEAALRGAVAAVVEDHPVRVSRLYDAAENPPARVGDPDVIRVGEAVRLNGRNWEVVQTFGRNGPVLMRDVDAAAQGAEVARAISSPREFARLTGVRIAQNDLLASSRELSSMPESLSEYIRRTGGISLDDAREYGLLAPGESPLGKLAGVVRREGRSLDMVREDVAQEAVGYIRPDADLNELAEAISRDLRGRSVDERVYSINDADLVRNRSEYEARFTEASRLAEMSDAEIEAARLDAARAVDENERGYDPVFEAVEDMMTPGGDPFDLETSAILAADIRTRSLADDRLAEARRALVQAEADLELMRRSGDLSEADYDEFAREVAVAARMGKDLTAAYEAGANCLARAVV